MLETQHAEISSDHGSDFNMHAGRDSTLQDLKSRFYWPCMDRDVSLFVHAHLRYPLKLKARPKTKSENEYSGVIFPFK
jgi:hypothetical protein